MSIAFRGPHNADSAASNGTHIFSRPETNPESPKSMDPDITRTARRTQRTNLAPLFTATLEAIHAPDIFPRARISPVDQFT